MEVTLVVAASILEQFLVAYVICFDGRFDLIWRWLMSKSMYLFSIICVGSGTFFDIKYWGKGWWASGGNKERKRNKDLTSHHMWPHTMIKMTSHHHKDLHCRENFWITSNFFFIHQNHHYIKRLRAFYNEYLLRKKANS